MVVAIETGRYGCSGQTTPKIGQPEMAHPAVPRRIGVFVFDGVQLLDVTGPIKVFHAANSLGADYEVRLYSPTGEPVKSSAGVGLAVSGDIRFPGVGHPGGLGVGSPAGRSADSQAQHDHPEHAAHDRHQKTCLTRNSIA